MLVCYGGWSLHVGIFQWIKWSTMYGITKNVSSQVCSLCQDDDERVSETAVVGYPHDLFGQGIAAYIILCDGVTDSVEDVEENLRKLVKSKIGSFAVPQKFMVSYPIT